MPKVVMLVSNPFRPDVRVYKEAKALVERGWEVEVVAWDRNAKFKQYEETEGILIRRVGPKALYGSMISHIINLPRFWRRSFSNAMKEDFNVLHIHDLDTLPPGVLMSRLKRIPLVYDAHESYGMMIEGSGAPRWLGKILDRLEEFLVPYTTNVIVVNPNWLVNKVYRGIYPVFEKKKIPEPYLVMNCRDLTGPPLPHPAGAFRIGYVGALEKGRLLIESIRAIGAMPEIAFDIGGFGNLMPILKKEAEGHPNVSLKGEIKLGNVLDFYSKCHVVFSVVDTKDEHERVGFPNRLFDAMAAGRALMVSNGSYAARDIVEEWKCGISVEPTESGIREGAKWLRDDRKSVEEMGKRGRVAFEDKYNWQIQRKGLFEIYDKF